MKITIIPVGQADNAVITKRSRRLNLTFGCPVYIDTALKLPARAWHHERNQYLASGLLDMLSAVSAGENGKVLGITGADLYAPGLNFVFGQADLTHRAVISLYRLDPRTYRLPPDNDLLLERAVKESIHELGHTMGLTHCTNPTCVMYFSGTLDDTDRKQAAFCGQCQPKLLK